MPPAEVTGSTLPAQHLPPLRRIDVSKVDASQITTPRKCIQSDGDLSRWKGSKAHRDVTLFVSRLGEAAVGKATQCTSQEKVSDNESVMRVISLMKRLDAWTREIEPQKTPQRFGNLAFRHWGKRLEESLKTLHEEILCGRSDLHVFIPELTEYLRESFGSFIRIDYGSGHEVSFLAWLAFLHMLGFFDPSSDQAQCPYQTSTTTLAPTVVEEDLSLKVLPLYFQVVWNLQDRYALEPAGSHGVWGLDDYQFIPYIIGAAQLRMQDGYKPQSFARPSHKPSRRLDASELLGFIPSRDAPPYANLFTTSIARIHSFKTGPFFEHSPLLSDIAATVPNWKKVHSGMLRMWDNEVMGKRPVVQHFVFGGIGYLWDDSEGDERLPVPAADSSSKRDSPTKAQVEDTRSVSLPPPTAAGAPWARPSGATTGPGVAYDPSISILGPRVGASSRQTSRPMASTPAPWAKKMP